MLTIRKQQIDILSEYMVKRFEDQVLAHLKTAFPETFEQKGEEGLRRIIRDGMEHTRHYGLVSEYDIARFLILRVLREDFDTNPETPWVGTVLNSTVLSPHLKMDQLCRHAESEFWITPDKWPALE